MKKSLRLILAVVAISMCVSAATEMKADALAVRFDAQGRMAVDTLYGKPFPLSGFTELAGCSSQGEVRTETRGKTHAFIRKVADGAGHAAILTDSFTPTKDSIRWDVEIISDGAPWSTAIETRVNYPATSESRFWTTWGHPDNQPNKWADPLAWEPFAARTCPYQYDTYQDWFVKQRTKNSAISIPIFSFAEPKHDAAFTLVQSPEDLLLDLTLTTTASGEARLSRKNYRLGGGKPVRFAMDLVAHPADPRAGIGWMVNRYPQFFNPANPNADRLSGCAAYSGSEAKFDPAPLRQMAFAFNWKCSEDFPYMGMFLPPVADAATSWKRAPDEETPGKPPTTSFQQMNDYARWMKEQGFQVLSYFNVTEYGRNMRFPAPPRQAKSDADLWKDPNDYLFHGGRQLAVLMNGKEPVRSNCYGALIVDPGDPAYRQHLLEQVNRNTQHLPDTAGIAIDRLDWLNCYNFNADDGVSWVNGQAARSLFVSWRELTAQLFPALRQAGKVVWVNNCTPRIEVVGQADGIYAEWAFPAYFNYAALTGVRKPVAIWTMADSELTDDYMQRLLYLGIFPTAPYPNNNHCLRPSPRANEQFLAYGPLMTAMRGRKWVLAPHCVETDTPEVKVNLFEVPGGGYIVPVGFGGKAETALVRVRHVAGLKNSKCEAIHPGVEKPVAVNGNFKDGVLELTVPLVRGCAMVKLTPNP
jgi:hypothetical protein